MAFNLKNLDKMCNVAMIDFIGLLSEAKPITGLCQIKSFPH